MMNLIILIIIFLLVGNILGKTILIQSIPKFKLVKRHAATIIKLYYGFYIYLFFNKEIDLKIKIKYMFLNNKIVMFTYCFCYCLEEYIEKHPQREFACKKNIKYMSSPFMRKNIYKNTEQSLVCA